MAEINQLPELYVYKFELGIIETNLDELEAKIDEELERRDSEVLYTDDQIKEKKVERSSLNNFCKVLNDWRIEKKRKFNEPLDKLEEQCKRITGKVKKRSEMLDSQIKASEQSQKDQKKVKMAAYWDEIKIHDIPLDEVFDQRWLNATCSEKEWKAALNQRRERISADLASFANYADPKMVDFMITEYMKTFDVQTCLDRWNEQVEAERRAEEAKAHAEEVRLAREEAARRRAEEEKRIAEQNASKTDQEQPKTEQKSDPRDFLYTRTFRITDATYDQMLSIFNYMKNLGIQYETIEKNMRRK